MKKIMLKIVIVAAIAGCFTNCGPKTPTDQFSAELFEQDGDHQRSSRIYVSGSIYRMESKLGEAQIVTIVDRTSGKAWIIAPEERAYTEVGLDHQQLINRDPFVAINYLKGKAVVEPGGEETLQGYPCRVESLTYQGRKVLTQYFSDDLNFALKVVNNITANKFLELRDIKLEPVSDSLITVPADYVQVDANPEIPLDLPEWVRDLSSAQVVQTPFERNLRAGEAIRIPVRSEASLWFQATQIGQTPADVRAIPFQYGQPVQDIDSYQNMVEEGVVCVRRSETTREANQVIVRVFEGAAKITGRAVPMRYKALKEGDVGILGLDPNVRLEEFRMVNSSDNEAVISWSFYQDGDPLDPQEYGPNVEGSVTLAPHEVKISSLNPPGNQLHVRSEKGEALISIGQWDPTKF